jgi:hypothetical protein
LLVNVVGCPKKHGFIIFVVIDIMVACRWLIV